MNDLDYIIVITNVFNLLHFTNYIIFSLCLCKLVLSVNIRKHIFTSYLLTVKENTVANNDN